MNTTQTVVARFDEDPSWLTPGLNPVVYNKGPELTGPAFPQVLLKNVGREAHSYLYHVVENYGALADVTLFCQGRVDDHLPEGASLASLLEVPAGAEATGFRLCRGLVEWDAGGRLAHHGKWAKMALCGEMRLCPLSFVAWWKKWVGADLLPSQGITYFPGSIFAARKECLLRRPLAFYQALLGQVSCHQNPEEAYFLERAWLHLFQVPLDKIAHLA